ncbi:peptidylprolyl isomerase [Pyxidicoccus parkwayensis]|uniref:peptidylprolyl isomerase n=1 Tax=Pyxidicoccus parkwayensis TaxID=2813578 RepID=A0ABX7P6R3_9BACT|nr:peptidylprolyl isomerase [Pyxidicoccus parkwaysis]QSQ26143.1 peptidylprolyl isomerase [Pyxidicoccus parkwaysis]
MNSLHPERSAPALLPSVRIATVLLVTALLATACRDEDVVAQVGRTEVRRADLDEFTSHRAREPGDTEAQLDALIARTRLAEEAHALDLDKRPEIRARLEAARREVLAQAVLEEKLQGATSEKTLRERYEATKDTLTRRQVHVRQIMVRLPAGADEATLRRARERANLLYARVIGGEPFEKVAREASEDEGSAARGGDLGVVREGQVHQAFLEAVAVLKNGELSKPFETPFGVHIAQALAPMEKVVPSYEEVRGRLAAESRNEAEARLSKELEERIPVKRFPQVLKNTRDSAPDAAIREEGSR